MDTGISLEPLTSDADLDALAAIVGEAFAIPVEDTRRWLDERVLRANARVLRAGGRHVCDRVAGDRDAGDRAADGSVVDGGAAEGRAAGGRIADGRVVGGLGVVPMGQFFGGRRLATGGVLGVAMLPAARGQGLAREMMRLSLREQYAAGFPISTLYPATISLYRRVDYEIAGTRSRLRAAARDLPTGGLGDVRVREIAAADYEELGRVYSESAAGSPGFLDRVEYLWRRIRAPQGRPARGFVAERGGRITGGVHYLQDRQDSRGHQTVELTDLTAADCESARALWALVGSHRSVVSDVTWYGSERDPLLLPFAERCFAAELADFWMVRIVNVEAALAGRGYPAGISAELHLEIQDKLIPENDGRWVLAVGPDGGRVKRGGRGELRLHVRDLSPLFSGYFSATELARVGRAAGTATAIACADALFASASPWMRDSF